MHQNVGMEGKGEWNEWFGAFARCEHHECSLGMWFDKIFIVQNMRTQVPLLETLIDMWDACNQFFMVGENMLTIEVEDVYFLIELSKWRALISLMGPKGRGESTHKYISLNFH